MGRFFLGLRSRCDTLRASPRLPRPSGDLTSLTAFTLSARRETAPCRSSCGRMPPQPSPADRFRSGPHATQLGEAQCVLGIRGCAGYAALNRPARGNELNRCRLDWFGCHTDYHELAVGPRPSISSVVALELGAVARMTLAPPSFCSACAALVVLTVDVQAALRVSWQRRVLLRRARPPQPYIHICSRIECRGGLNRLRPAPRPGHPAMRRCAVRHCRL